jgi:Lar family restriction alleviation protein
MSELKLLPCPFCGGAATVGASEYYDGANTFYIYCASCGVQQMTTKIRTDEAIAAWNRRADHIRDTTKKVSNADRVRSMSDEELANELTRNPPIPCRMCE